jgi:hypothetical protein
MRFTLLKMFIAVAMVALACAAMIYRTTPWASIILTLTVALYAIVALRAVGQRSQERAFSVGFAIVGTAYLLLATCPLLAGFREYLGTNYLLAFAARTVAASDASLVLPHYLSLARPYTSYIPGNPAPPPASYVYAPSTTVYDNSTDPAAPVSGAVPIQEAPALATNADESATAITPPSASSTSLSPPSSDSYAPPIMPVFQRVVPLDTLIGMGMSGNALSPLARFFLIGHCVWSWLFALAGGWFAARTIARR